MTTYLGYDINVLKKTRPAQRTVTRLDLGRFLLKYKNLPSFELEMDFTPFKRIFDLQTGYTLLHWQAAPKGFRTFGAYVNTPERDDYLIFDYNQFRPGDYFHELLQVDEILVNSKPTAVILYRGMVPRVDEQNMIYLTEWQS